MSRKKKTSPNETPVEVLDSAPESAPDGAGSSAQQAELEQQLNEALAKASEYLAGWQQERSDFANYKRRIERDQQQEKQLAIGNAIRRYLDILDDLDRALKNRPAEGEGATWASGIELIFRKFQTAIEVDGVKSIPAEGQFFDPNMHEALMQSDSAEHESGQVIEVFQQGYTIGDRVLRPARVRVAR